VSAYLFLLFAAAFGFQEQIWRCRYNEGSQIHSLENSLIDVTGVLDGKLDVRVQRPQDIEAIKSIVSDCEIIVEDLIVANQKFLDTNEAARIQYPDFYNVTAGTSFPDWFKSYHSLEEFTQWYDSMQSTYPNLVRRINLNNASYEGRAIQGFTVYNFARGVNPTYTTFHSAGIHAREWIAPATAQFIAYQLVNLYTLGNDTIITNFVNTVRSDFYFSINPDGYTYSRLNANTRQWRKNRNPPPSGTCIGTDENRNFADHWGQGGSSNDPCSDTYMGRSAGSEKEVQAIAGAFNNLAQVQRVIIGIDWHSYSQLFLRPYGWTNSVCPDETRLATIGTNYTNVLRTAFNMSYTSQRSYQLYQTTGSAQDWYYGASNPAGARRTAAWTVELRPTGANPGFNLPPDQIIPTGYENWIAIRFLFDSIRTNPLP